MNHRHNNNKTKEAGNTDNNTNSQKKNGKRSAKGSRNNGHGYKRNCNKRDNKDVALSKGLSWILRHGALKVGLAVSSDGYIPIPSILNSQAKGMNQYTIEDIIRIVETNDKQRFKLCKKNIIWNDVKKHQYSFVLKNNCDDGNEDHEEILCIRANQGHSIKGIDFEELLTPISPGELTKMGSSTIVHGTNKDAWETHIQHEGLNSMNRNHIHFASGLPGEDGVISGMRKNSQVYIYIDGNTCAKDGIKFYQSANGVILTAGVENSGILPVRYFASVIDAKTNNKIN